jgi:RNA polymerase sigma factor (sigma-70 family)
MTEPETAQSVTATSDGFTELYLREYGPMVGLATALVDERGRAEEIVQDAFAKTLSRWQTIDEPGSYVRMAVVNGARSELRRRQVRRRASFAPQPVDRGDSEYLADAVAQLTPRRRIAVVLRFWADLSHVEIARLLSCRTGTVKSLVSRGLADLREVIER